MLVIVAGGGRTGAQLANLLLAQKQEVHTVEARHEVLARIHRELPTEMIYEGVPTEPSVLEQAGIRDCQVLAACTTNDADNLALCFLARSAYHVPRTIARINNPRNAWLFGPQFHVDVALNQAETMAGLIVEEMSMGDMMTLLKLRRGQHSVVEETITAGAKALGVEIKDLPLPENCVIAAIIRRGQVIVPRGVTTIEGGGEVLAVTDRNGAEQLSAVVAPQALAQPVGYSA